MITDAFITKFKIALLKDFLIEMAVNGKLKRFVMLNREALSGVSMKEIQMELLEVMPKGFSLQAEYFYG